MQVDTEVLDLGYMVGKVLEVFIFESGSRFELYELTPKPPQVHPRSPNSPKTM